METSDRVYCSDMDSDLRNGLGFLVVAAVVGLAAIAAGDSDATGTIRAMALILGAGGLVFVLKSVLSR